VTEEGKKKEDRDEKVKEEGSGRGKVGAEARESSIAVFVTS